MGHDEHDHDAHGHDHDHAHGHDHDHAHDHDHGHGHHGHGHDHPHAHAAADDHAHGHAAEVVKDAPFGLPRTRIAVGDGVELATVDRGDGPPIVFLHGFPTSSALWRHVIAALEGRARCIAPDLLGLGESSGPPEAALGIEAQADYVARMLDRLDLGEVVLVGHDWGGGVAQALLARQPERISRFVLCNSPAFDYRSPPAITRFTTVMRFPFVLDLLLDTGILPFFARRELRRGSHEGAAPPEDAIAHYLSPLFRDTPPAYRPSRERFRRTMLAWSREAPSATLAAADALRRFAKPTLVVWGCEDPWISTSYAKKLADEIPGCNRLELVAFCGHWVPEERPQELAALIADFAELKAPAEAAA
jgi:pimeloyl-ACP methyl ester carboxylesterase